MSVPASAVAVDVAAPPLTRHPLSHDLADAGARVVVAALFLVLAWHLGRDFLATGHVTGLLLLLSESLVAVLTVFRRHAIGVDRRTMVRAVTAISLIAPLMLRPATGQGVLPELMTVPVAAVGLCIVIAGKLSLGRSFGLLPAHRGLVCGGLYQLVRHPIYLGYMLTHVAFVAAHATPWNLAAVVTADLTLILRAHLEERTLASDPGYVRYASTVRWRLIPGVY